MILLGGRYAGRKAIILRVNEGCTAQRKFPHCLVAGIDRYPRRVHKGLSKKRIANRIKVKPFIKYVNVNHVMPTRYNISAELGVDQIVSKLETLGDKENKEQQKDVLAKQDTRDTMRKHLKGYFEEKYSGLDLNDTTQLKNTRLKFFFKKLRF